MGYGIYSNPFYSDRRIIVGGQILIQKPAETPKCISEVPLNIMMRIDLLIIVGHKNSIMISNTQSSHT